MADPRQAILDVLDRDDEAFAVARQVFPTTPESGRDAAYFRELDVKQKRNAGVPAVVELHRPSLAYHFRCFEDGERLPCPTIRALADAYAPGWNAPVADSEVGL